MRGTRASEAGNVVLPEAGNVVLPEAGNVVLPEAGNVMVYILLGIVMLAALSYAITQGGRDTGQNLSAEKQRLLATEIIDDGDTIQKSVQLLRSRGTAFSALSFASPGLSAAYGTPGAVPANEIFNDAGAAAIYKQPDALSFASGIAQDFVFTANNEVAQVGTTCGTTDCTDLLLVLPGLNADVCAAIDTELGLALPPPATAQFDLTPYAAGAITYGQTIGGTAGSPLAGKTAACAYDTHAASYTFYQVLQPR